MFLMMMKKIFLISYKIFVYSNHLKFLCKYIFKNKLLSASEQKPTPKTSSPSLTLWFLSEEAIAEKVKIIPQQTYTE